MEPFDLSAWTKAPCIIDQVTIDSRRIHSKNSLFIALTGAHYDGHDFVRAAFRQGANCCIVRHDFFLESVPQDKFLIRVDDPLRALQQIAAEYRRQMPAQVIAITGSFGKTMLKDLLFTLLESEFNTFASPESFNSQIGVALSLLKIKRTHRIAIIEAGISQAGEMAHLAKMIQPDFAILTNLAPSLLLHPTQILAREKMQLLNATTGDDWVLLPFYAKEWLEREGRAHFWDQDQEILPKVFCGGESRYCVDFPNAQGLTGALSEGHYVLDLIKMGVKAAHLVGVSSQGIAKGLERSKLEPMRIEVFKSQQGTTFINDTYTADPMSCDIALRQMELLEDAENKSAGKKIFLFGGLRCPSEPLECDMARLAHAIAKHKINLVVVSQPESAALLVSHLSLASPHTELVVCKDTKSAIEATKRHMGPLDVVLIKGAHKIPLQELIRTVEESPPNNQVIINLAVIQSNIDEIRARLRKDTRIMVMVKALAYGTDDVRIAKFLKSCGIDILGVSYVDEGVQMRQAGVKQHIFVLNAAEYEAAKAVTWDLEVGVSEPKLIQELQEQARAQNKKIRVHLHLDTGMSRLGCRQEQVVALAQMINGCPNLLFEGIFTHFACAEDPQEDAFTLQQAALLQQAIDTVEQAGYSPRWRHACNSSATLRFGFSQFNMVRLGLAAYGLHSSCACKEAVTLRPAISLLSRIVGINDLKRGDTVSYGRTYTIDRDEARLAVLPIGYFDGLHRNYSGKGYVRIHGKKAVMVGAICMDYMMVDISEIPEAKIGDQVLIFGEDDNGDYISPVELATRGGSIVHELMTCLGPRIRRFFIYDESLRPR